MGRLAKELGALAALVLIVSGLGVLVLYRLGAEPEAALSIERIQATEGFPVNLTSPVRADFTDYLICDGSVVADVKTMLRAKISEIVEAIHVRVGEVVQSGQLLVAFRTDDLQAQFEAAQAAYEESVSSHARQTNLRAQGVVSQERLEQARTAMEAAQSSLRLAESRLASARVVAPIGGLVDERFVEPGEYIGVGDELIGIVDLATVEVRALVPEQEMAGLAAGASGEFRLEGSDRWHSGTVARTGPSTDDPDGFFSVYVRAVNVRDGDQWLMRPGMYATVRFLRRLIPGALAVPEGALAYRGERRVAYAAVPAVEEVPVGPSENPGAGPARPGGFRRRLARGLAKLTGQGREGAAQRVALEERTVTRAREVEVTAGLRQEGLVELTGGAIAEDSPLVMNPQEALGDGSLLKVLREAD
jgi:RND family efflux transporter MFP subunit